MSRPFLYNSCVFVYKQEHLENAQAKPIKKGKSKKRDKIFKVMNGTLQVINDAMGLGNISFEKCTFIPARDEEDIKQFIRERVKDPELIFYKCEFVRRSRTVFEKLVQRVITNPKVFGLIQLGPPTINYVSSVENYSFRLKDVSAYTGYICRRIFKRPINRN